MHRVKVFSVCPSQPSQMSWAGVGRKVREDVATTSDLNWPREYSFPIMSCSAVKTGLEEEGLSLGVSKAAAVQRLAGQSVRGRWEAIFFSLIF